LETTAARTGIIFKRRSTILTMTLQQLNYTETQVTQVTQAVCKHLNISFEQLNIKTRGEKDIAYARQLCMYMLTMNTRLTQKKIAEIFDRERSGVSYAVSTITQFIREDVIVKRDVMAIEKAIAQ